jgi:hypothetical protein
MLIDRDHVVRVLSRRGMAQQGKRAGQVPDVQVDTVRDAGLLRELGIDPDSRAQGGNLATIEPPDKS